MSIWFIGITTQVHATGFNEILDGAVINDLTYRASKYAWLRDQNDKKIAFEYDGPVHYDNMSKIERDVRKSIELEKQGYTLVRFPYYLQFTKDVAKHFFEPYNVYSDKKYQRMLEEFYKIKNESDMLAPGWHETSQTPSNWVDKGFEIFLRDIETFPISIRHQLVHSLNLYKAATNGKEWLVVPLHNENFNKFLSLEVEEKYLNYFFCRS